MPEAARCAHQRILGGSAAAELKHESRARRAHGEACTLVIPELKGKWMGPRCEAADKREAL